MKYELQPTVESDKETIREMNNRCYREVVVRQFGGWDVDIQHGFFEKKWEPARLQKILCENEIVGVLWVERREDHVEVLEIQIDPEFQGRGLGTAVLSDILGQVDQAGLSVKLQVLFKNRAKALYERLGFVVTGETDTHYLMERAA